MRALLSHTPTCAIFLALSASLLSCAPTTRVVAAWKAPELGALVVERPVVVFQHTSEALRRSVEDALAQRIPNAVASYRVIPTAEIFDVEGVQTKVQQAGFDTVMITQLVEVREEIDILPGDIRPTYNPLWGAWSAGWVHVAEPVRLDETTVVTLESHVFALDQAGSSLVWAGRSETFDPSSVEDLAHSAARAAVKAMSKDGVVAAAEPK